MVTKPQQVPGPFKDDLRYQALTPEQQTKVLPTSVEVRKEAHRLYKEAYKDAPEPKWFTKPSDAELDAVAEREDLFKQLMEWYKAEVEQGFETTIGTDPQFYKRLQQIMQQSRPSEPQPQQERKSADRGVAGHPGM